MRHRLVSIAACGAGAVAAAVLANRLAGRPVPFLRWSVVRFLLSRRRVLREGRVGDGREDALARYVAATAPAGDIDAVVEAIDRFARRTSFLMNVGDEKGAILEDTVRRTRPRVLLELGAYCGYSALRAIRAAPPGAHLYSVEINPANADVARRVWAHAGVAHRITAVVGFLGDGGRTLDELGFDSGGVDFVFLDHLKSAYLPDLQSIVDADWLHPGSVVVADNVRIPGAPDYLAYMRRTEGMEWCTAEHRAHVEYQRMLPDLVLESIYLGTGEE